MISSKPGTRGTKNIKSSSATAIHISKTEAGAANSARYSNFTQRNYIQRGFAKK
jgi:hypothetical protein